MLVNRYQLERGLAPAPSAYAAAYSTGFQQLHEIHPVRETEREKEHKIVNKYAC